MISFLGDIFLLYVDWNTYFIVLLFVFAHGSFIPEGVKKNFRGNSWIRFTSLLDVAFFDRICVIAWVSGETLRWKQCGICMSCNRFCVEALYINLLLLASNLVRWFRRHTVTQKNLPRAVVNWNKKIFSAGVWTLESLGDSSTDIFPASAKILSPKVSCVRGTVILAVAPTP